MQMAERIAFASQRRKWPICSTRKWLSESHLRQMAEQIAKTQGRRDAGTQMAERIAETQMADLLIHLRLCDSLVVPAKKKKRPTQTTPPT